MNRARLALLLAVSLLIPGTGLAKKKSNESSSPSVGWYTVPGTKDAPGWKGSCYFPPNWAKMPETERRVARQEALEAMTAQWSGQKDEFVSFGESTVELVNNTLLGRPDQIEQVSVTNADYCKKVMAEGASVDAWGSWLRGLTGHLNEGQCLKPFDYTLTQYLSVETGWQEQIPMCQGNKVLITATQNDKFRLSKNGPWLDVEGDPNERAVGTTMPCNQEGCFRGQLVGLFVTQSGVQTVFPIGSSKSFTAPEHGTFSFSINDDSWDDNQWRSKGSITDHTAVTISPAQ